MLIGIEAVGKLNNESGDRSCLFMPPNQIFIMKSFILAATSIACILSISSIATAEIQTVESKLANNSINSALAIKTSCQKALSTEDTKKIYNLLIARYQKINSLSNRDVDEGLKDFVVVKNLAIVDCEKQAYTREIEVFLESTELWSEYYKNIRNGQMTGVSRTKTPTKKVVRIDTYVKDKNGKWKNHIAASSYREVPGI